METRLLVTGPVFSILQTGHWASTQYATNWSRGQSTLAHCLIVIVISESIALASYHKICDGLLQYNRRNSQKHRDDRAVRGS